MNEVPLGKSTDTSESKIKLGLSIRAASSRCREKGAAWLKRVFQRRSKIADLNLALAEHCFVCPLPLWVDGRRIDALQNCPNHGWTSSTAALVLKFPKGSGPCFRVPPGTFAWQALKFHHQHIHSPLPKTVLPPLPDVKPSLGFQLSWRLKDAKKAAGFSKSTCYWVMHGAVIARENFAVPPSHYPVGAYLCANDQLTDLSGFALRKTADNERRLQLAGALIAQTLTALELPFQQEMKALDQHKLSAFLGGFSFLAVLTLTGAAPALIAGASMAYLGRAVGQKSSEDYQKNGEMILEEIGLQACQWELYYSRYSD